MISCVFLVLIVELINSAIEATVDRISLDDHRLVKRAKNIGSASVLIGLLNLVTSLGTGPTELTSWKFYLFPMSIFRGSMAFQRQ